MKRIATVLVLLVCVALAVGTMWFLYNKSKKKSVAARTETAEKRELIKKTVATGAIVPREEVEIKPRVSGVIEELSVEPGAKIKAGDKIARIQIVPDAASLQRAQSSVQSARIAYDNAKREVARSEGLFHQGVISEAELQKAQTELAMRQADLNGAAQSLQIVKDGATAGGKQSNVVVTSTVDGMVIDVPVKVGFSVIESNTFNAGTTIAVVADMSDMIFDGQIDESEVGKIKVGLPLSIKIGALEKETFDGTLEYIAPKGKEVDGAIQFEIKASVTPKPGVFVRAGYSANADVVLDRRPSTTLALREALVQFNDGKPFVEVETGKRQFAKREVKLGLSDGIYVEVLSGIDEKDKIKQPSNAGPPGMGGGRQGPPRGRGR